MAEGYYEPKPKKGSKKELLKRAVAKLRSLNKQELENFLKINCCPHKHAEKCGMDRICKDCGDWC